MLDNHRQTKLMAAFHRRFGGEPSLEISASGRVDLMGSHTDYNHGFVLTLPLERDTRMVVRPRRDGVVAVYSLNTDSGAEFDLGEIHRDHVHTWTNYVRGVADVLQAEGHALTGFSAVIHSTIPLSSGLSSSAALEVATARAFDRLSKLELEPVRLALLCQRAENQFVGVNCGILDQYTSSVGEAGSALLLDCRNLTSTVTPLDPSMRVVICDTRYKRELRGSEYAERRAQCERGAARLAEFIPGVKALRDVTLEQFSVHAGELEEVVQRRCCFILEENQRTLDLAKALPMGDRNAICSLTAASFAGARDLYAIVSNEMEVMMGAMLNAPGVIGARQAGAGFGGCMAAYVENEAVEPFATHVRQAYQSQTGIEPRVYVA